MPQMLDIAEAAELLGTSERHLRSLVFKQGVPVTRLGRKLRFRVADLETWIDANTTPAT